MPAKTKAQVQGIPLGSLSSMPWVGDIPLRGAAQHPERAALIFAERGKTLTYAALKQHSNAFAAELQSRGVRDGERIAYLGRNSDLFFPVLFGCIGTGVVLVTLNWRQSADEIAYQLADSGATLLLVDADMEETARQASAGLAEQSAILIIDGEQGQDHHLRALLERNTDAPEIPSRHEPQQTVLQVYTSGTTGQPKGVLISHESLSIARYAELISPDWADWTADGVTLSAMPNFHVGGLSWVIIGLIRLSTVVITADPMPGNMLALIREYSVERSFIVPTVIRAILDELQSSQTPAPRIKGIYYGAMPMSEAMLREAMSLFSCKFGQFFGMTELTGTATYLPPSEHDLERPELLRSVGRPIAGMSIEIRSPDRQVLNVGEPGEIWIKAPTLMQGYWQLPDKTAEVVVDGWYATGDGGYLTEDGFLFLTDRVKDMIVSGGENIYPIEVENALLQHPSVMAAAVVGVPDERWGESVTAVIELRPGCEATAEELRSFVRSRIAAYKCPRLITFSAALPRTASGKIQRGRLRSLVMAEVQ